MMTGLMQPRPALGYGEGDMPGPRLFSRYSFCERLKDAQGRFYLSERTPFRYRALADNRVHVVERGDTLTTLADKYFHPQPNAAQLWWVIADFQRDPIHDPTIELPVGQTLVIPSVDTLLNRIFAETRSEEA